MMKSIDQAALERLEGNRKYPRIDYSKFFHEYIKRRTWTNGEAFRRWLQRAHHAIPLPVVMEANYSWWDRDEHAHVIPGTLYRVIMDGQGIQAQTEQAAFDTAQKTLCPNPSWS